MAKAILKFPTAKEITAGIQREGGERRWNNMIYWGAKRASFISVRIVKTALGVWTRSSDDYLVVKLAILFHTVATVIVALHSSQSVLAAR